MSAQKQQRTDGEAVYKALSDLMEFDQSKSSSWPRITILVEAGGADQYQDESVTVYPNGRTYNIQRSVNAPVPPEVVDALQSAVTAIMVQDKNAATGYSPRDMLRFPYRIVDSASQLRYSSWKKGQDVLRHVVTETRAKPSPDGKKMVYEVISRYLPDEKLAEASEIINWAREENAKEGEKAAALRAAVA